MKIVLAYIIEIILYIIIVWLIGYISVLIHETGHAIGFMCAIKSRDWRITIGSGRKILESKRFTVNLLPFGGLFELGYNGQMSIKRNKLCMLAGGPLATLLLLIPLILLRIVKLGETGIVSAGMLKRIIGFASEYNLVLLVVTVLPFSYPFGVNKGMESDGLQIWRQLKRNDRDK